MERGASAEVKDTFAESEDVADTDPEGHDCREGIWVSPNEGVDD
jgi:hypothetical protein